MKTYLLHATARVDARSDAEARALVAQIRHTVSVGYGYNTYDWQVSAEEEDEDPPTATQDPRTSADVLLEGAKWATDGDRVAMAQVQATMAVADQLKRIADVLDKRSGERHGR